MSKKSESRAISVRLSTHHIAKLTHGGQTPTEGLRSLLDGEGSATTTAISMRDFDRILAAVRAILDNIREGRPYDHQAIAIARAAFDRLLVLRGGYREEAK